MMSFVSGEAQRDNWGTLNVNSLFHHALQKRTWNVSKIGLIRALLVRSTISFAFALKQGYIIKIRNGFLCSFCGVVIGRAEPFGCAGATPREYHVTIINNFYNNYALELQQLIKHMKCWPFPYLLKICVYRFHIFMTITVFTRENKQNLQ